MDFPVHCVSRSGSGEVPEADTRTQPLQKVKASSQAVPEFEVAALGTRADNAGGNAKLAQQSQ